MRNGIPILVDLKKLPAHLQSQVKYFEHEDMARGKFVLEPWQKRYVDNFLSAAPKPGGLIIDCATGSGYMAIELAKRGFQVIATDLTLAELLKLQKNAQRLKLSDRLLCVCANSEELPIKTLVADGLVANAILEHLPHEQKAVNEFARVLKSEALLMLAMPIDLRYVWPLLWPINRMHDKNIGHLRRYSRTKIIQRFSSFCEMRTYYTGSLAKILCMALKLLTKNPRFDMLGEHLDELFARFPYGASNVVSILRKL